MRFAEASPAQLSSKAYVQLAQLELGKIEHADAFSELCKFILEPQRAFGGGQVASRLVDFRTFPMIRDAIGESIHQKKKLEHDKFLKLVEEYLLDLRDGVERGHKKQITEAKRFSLALADVAVSREIASAYDGRDRVDFGSANENVPFGQAEVSESASHN